ncbi:MAG TPA: MFS transporter [Blastocatellia bacterium]|nr:MFS transporter [Blastocatellia bacterium]
MIGLAYLGFVSLGLPDGLHGVAWPFVRATFNLPLDALGTLLVVFTAGYLLSSFSSGRLLARMSVGTLLAASCLLMAVSLAGYALTPRWVWMVCVTAIAGAGSGAIDAGLNTYAATNFSPRTVNWLHACYGVGASAGPVIMTSVLNAGYVWRWGYGIVAVSQLVMAVAFGFTRNLWKAGSTGEPVGGGAPAASSRSTLRLPVVWLSVATFFVYTGLESAAGTWAFSLFTEGRAIAVREAGLWVSVYFGCLTAGRVGFGFVAEWGAARWLLRCCLVSIVMGAALIWMNASGMSSFLGLALIGFAAGPIFPSLIAATPRRVGEAHTANAVGFQIAAAVLGASLVPAAVGILADRFGLESVGPALLFEALVLIALYESLRFIGPKVAREATLPA